MPDNKINTRRNKPNIQTINVQSPSMNAVNQFSYGDQMFEKLQNFLTQKLDDLEQRLMDRIGTLSADISNLRNDLGRNARKVSSLEVQVAAVNEEVSQLRSRIHYLENDVVSSDFIVRGVPNNVNEEDVVKKLFSAIGAQNLDVRSVSRVRSKNGDDDKKKCLPIIARLNSGQQRTTLLTRLAAFRKTSKRNICRNDVGLSGTDVILVHESLTYSNRKLLHQALRLKSALKLHAAFTLRGNVFVRRMADDDAVMVRDNVDLDAVVGES